jgi:hypothetical protein
MNGFTPQSAGRCGAAASGAFFCPYAQISPKGVMQIKDFGSYAGKIAATPNQGTCDEGG